MESLLLLAALVVLAVTLFALLRGGDTRRSIAVVVDAIELDTDATTGAREGTAAFTANRGRRCAATPPLGSVTIGLPDGPHAQVHEYAAFVLTFQDGHVQSPFGPLQRSMHAGRVRFPKRTHERTRLASF